MKNILLISCISFLMSCYGTLPVMDANLMETNASLSGRVSLNKDAFVSNEIFKDTAKSLHNSLLYYYPINFTISNTLFNRLEIGGWLLGVYAKYLVIKPDNYSFLSFSNLAFSTFISVHEAGILVGGHDTEEMVQAGLLLGVPLNSYFSFTTGLIGSYSTNGTSYMRDDSLWQVNLSGERQRLIIPINLLYKMRRNNFKYFGYCMLGIPFDYNETYTLHYDFVNKDEKIKIVDFTNKMNYEIRIGLGIEKYNRQNRATNATEKRAP